ncbi:MAG: methyltransferase domain-containing protein [Dehalococcoidia bacterium]|nr:methyltransferase domain-containing protein [Dehalococcoidia bacterium]
MVPAKHHHDAHHHEVDPAEMRQSLLIHDRVFARTHREIAEWLGIDRGSRVFDAGCGVGGMAEVFAERAAEVVAVDLDDENVRHTVDRIDAATRRAAIDVRVGDLLRLDDPDDAYDLVWCSRVVHHLPDMLAGVTELARVTKPGGTVAIREGGFGFRVLPDDIGYGERWFEDRLAAAGVGRFGRPPVTEPDSVPYPFGWSQLLVDAGLVDIRAKTFGFDALSPLSDDERAWIEHHWRRWLAREDWRARLQPADIELLGALLDPASEHYVFARTDLHLRAGLTVYAGRRPA